MVQRLKDFISRIRASKTAADERAVVAKESASIRTLLKEESPAHRHVNVAKLLYIHMLGYPAMFGQIECVKLIASPRFSDKRLGYLGTMLLLDENQETLTLVTNSLKNDLNHNNMFYVALALNTLGNIASVSMAMDLCPEIEKLMASSNAYLRKKASLCAVRILRKAPELHENFVSRCRSAIIERNSGPLLTNLSLMAQLCSSNPEAMEIFRKHHLSDLVRQLRVLITSGYSPEHDVSGITDPFMQVRIIRLLRTLATNYPEALDTLNDVLAQVATNTDGSKNVGNAILYETVLTILDVPVEQTLRVLAINILGKFLSNKDNNIRYVALQTLLRTIHVDAATLQRHRATIIECLRDSDVSIRRRALELAFALTNATNVRIMTRELLAFLEVADLEFRQMIACRLCSLADRFAPNPRWHLDTVLRVMKLAGKHLNDDVVAQFVCLATNNPALHAYAISRLYHLLASDISQEGLVHAGVWLIGELGDVLVQFQTASAGAKGLVTTPAPDGPDDETDFVDESRGGATASPPSEESVFMLLKKILESPKTLPASKNYVLTALIKLSARFTSPRVLDQIRGVFKQYATSPNLELQIRALQFLFMLDLEPSIRSGLWERMPLVELKDPQKYSRNAAAAVTEKSQKSATKTDETSMLLELGGMSLVDAGGSQTGNTKGGLLIGTARTSSFSQHQQQQHQPRNTMDIMAEIFSVAPTAALGSAAGITGVAASGQFLTSPGTGFGAQPTGGQFGGTVGAFGGNEGAAGGWNKEHSAFSSAELDIWLTPSREIAGIAVSAAFVARSVGVTKLQMLVAVPKTMSIQLMAITSDSLRPGERAEQKMVLRNPEKKPIKLRLKVSYQLVGGAAVDQVVEFKFPGTIV